jgi:hypothetical protein
MKTTLYIAETFGSNASAAHAVDAQGRQYSSASRHPSSVVHVGGYDLETGGGSEPVPALFESREDAQRVALACHWNGQSFGVRAARGRIRDTGTVIPAGVGKVSA